MKFRNLKIWHKGIEIVKSCYCRTKDFPESERFDLTLQMRLSAVSIPSNIAEGKGEKGLQNFFAFYTTPSIASKLLHF